MTGSTWELVEEVVESSGSVQPIRSGFLPRLAQVTTLDEVERAIGETASGLTWVGEIPPGGSEQRARALEGIVAQMLSMQEELERAIDAVSDPITARKVIVAHETLRRLLATTLDEARAGHSGRSMRSASDPATTYIREMAVRLVLLIAALENLRGQASSLISAVAQRAFETSQTLRRAMRGLGVDLTPWIDAPAPTRARRIVEAATMFWSTLDSAQRRAVDDAWGERVEFPSKWPLPQS